MQDKTILILGATGDIGSKCALDLGKKNANLVLLGRSQERLDELLTRLPQGAGKYWTYQCDLTDIGGFSKLLEVLRERHRAIHGFVHSAGRAGTEWNSISLQEWNSTMDVNLTSAFTVVKYLEPSLINAKSSSVVMISSLAAIEGYPKIDYGASKAGMNAAIRSLAVIFGSSGIRFNAVAPGPVPSWSTKNPSRSVFISRGNLEAGDVSS